MEEMNQAPADPKKLAWYFKNVYLVISFLTVGPFMLPLVWFNPRMDTTRKLLWTVAIGIASYFIVVFTMDSVKKIMDAYQQMKESLPY